MSSPFISVIVPTYNRAQVLGRAIKSVLEQTFSDYELIIVDDGSVDSTREIVEGLNSPKIKYFFIENQGVSAARNHGASHARGEWLAFLDSDDEWLPDKLELQKLVVDRGEHCLVHSEEIWIRNGERVNQSKKYKKGGGDQFSRSLNLCAISPSTALIRKDTFIEMNGFREDYPVCEDYDLWLKITSKYEVGFEPKALIKKHGGHEDQLSFRFKAMDYWRILSIDWILDNRDLSKERFEAATAVLEKKIKILLNGYKKHGNMKNYSKVESIGKKRELL